MNLSEIKTNKHIGFVWLATATMQTASYLSGNLLILPAVVMSLLCTELYLGLIRGRLVAFHNWVREQKEIAVRRRRYDDIVRAHRSGILTDEILEEGLRALVKDKDWDVPQTTSPGLLKTTSAKR